MARAVFAGRYFAVESDDHEFWAIRRYDHHLTAEQAKGKVPGEYETVAYARDKDGAKAAIADLIQAENLTP